ncbi:archease [soil metagenome]
MGAYEIVEHTADVGVRAQGASLAEVFEQATLGLCDIAGILAPGRGEEVDVKVESAPDLGSLLVDWLSEVLYLHDTRGAAVAALRIDEVSPGRASGSVALTELRPESAGTQVKAVTYHQLSVEQTPGGWAARVYFDI